MPTSSAPYAVLSKVPPSALDNVLRVGGYQAVLRKQEAEAELESAQNRVTAPPEYDAPVLRGDARKLWESTEHEVILSGPAETGKTWAALHKLNMLMWKYPGAQAAIIRKVYNTMHGSVLQTYRRILGKETLVHAYGGEKPEWFDYPNGSRVWVGGLDNPQKSLSSERDIIYVNQAEELELDDFEVLTTRCTGRGGVMPFAQIFGDCNPGPASHWILNRPSLRLLYSRHEDNPTLFDDTGHLTEQGRRSIGILDGLTGVRKKRLRFGLWVGAEGQVYETWDRSIHVLTKEQLYQAGIFLADGTLNKGNVRNVIGTVDWGWTNPGVIQVWVTDSDGRAYLVREIYCTGQRIDWWVGQAQAVRDTYDIRQFYCDPSEPAYIAAFNAGHCNATGARNAITVGIQAVQKRLPVQPDGRARLFVYNGALEERDPALYDQKKPCGVIEEMDGYVWQKNQNGKPNKELPVDKDNHGEDCTRYACMALDYGQGSVSSEAQEIIEEWG